MKKLFFTVIISAAFVSVAFAQTRKTGLKKDPEKYKAMNLVEKPLGFGANLPEKFSLERYMPSIGDQGDLGTCVGWSSTYYAATIAYNMLADENNIPTEDHFNYDPIHTFENIKDVSDAGCQDGAYIEDALIYMIENGVKRGEIDPGSCGTDNNWYQEQMSIIDIAAAYRLFDYEDAPSDIVESVCQVLVNKKPVIIAMGVAKSFFLVGEDGYFNPEDDEPGNFGGHAMCVIGYDDNKYGGSFKVANSWGSSWGDDGYVYIKYDDFVEYCWGGYYFDTELKPVKTAKNACIYGNCYNGYGVKDYKGRGVYEGLFASGDPVTGVYYNPTKKGGKGGVRWMKKVTRSGSFGTRLLYESNDSDTPVGFILD
ncbi:MAG: C1 family peptidase [Bacteroidota bacterium]|jgi:hypothetical protein